MRKFMIMLLSVTCLVLCAIALAACVPKDLKPHDWSEEWRHTIEKHWHYCTVDGCSAKNEEGQHNLYVYEIYADRQPTCGKPGRGVWKCADCGITIEDSIPAGFAFEGGVLIDGVPMTVEHQWKREYTAVEATCNKDGSAFNKCEVCGEIEKVVLQATGEHRYLSGNWEISAAGHQQICADCKTPSGLLPHVAGSPQTTPISGMNDGKVEYFCADCGYAMGVERITNPAAPVSLEVSIAGVTLTPMAGMEGWAQVNLTVGQTYTLSFTARDGNNNRIDNSSIRECVMASDEGIMGYYLQRGTYQPLPINPNYVNENIADSRNVTLRSKTLIVNTSGQHTVQFWYETGYYGDNDPYTGRNQRASFTLIINPV